MFTLGKAQRGIEILHYSLSGGGGGDVNATPRPLYPRKRLGNNCTGGWVGLRGVRTGAKKSHPQRNSIPQPSSR